MLFTRSHLEDAVQWFFELSAAASDYETNYQNLVEACRKGLNFTQAEKLVGHFSG